MADDTIRDLALGFAFRAADLRTDEFGYVSLDDVVTDVLGAADRFAAWLVQPLPGTVTRLVLNVGPVTEQP